MNGLQQELNGKKKIRIALVVDMETNGIPTKPKKVKRQIGKKLKKSVNTKIAIRFAVRKSAFCKLVIAFTVFLQQNSLV